MLILAALVLVGVVLYIGELRWRRKNGGAEENSSASKIENSQEGLSIENTSDNVSANSEDVADSSETECCGQHLVCEKETLSPITDEIVYYDDEELDRFIGRASESYSEEEVEEFREVLMTLRQEDVPGWARSVTQRRLELPSEVRDELFMLVRDMRAQ